jgi:hypothetical protein
VTLGIPTRGRSESLVEAVRGHVSAARGRPRTLVVADSSDEPEAGTTRAALTALRAPPALQLRWAGRAERARYVPLLAARAGVDPALLEYALCGSPRSGSDSGANRNALLLDLAGQPIVLTDDDVRARAARPLRDAAPLALTTGDPFEAWFAPPRAPLVPDTRWEHVDVLALHETLLGADVACAAQGAGEGLVLAARVPFYRRLARRGGRVVTTQLGCAGDHGMGASFSLLLLGGASRERLLASPATFEDAFFGRRIARAPAGPTISDTAFCMGMSLGIDARSLVPPFSPSGRNADGLFGATARACLGDAFAGFLPWAVEHAPPGGRAATLEDELAIAGRPEANDLVRAALGHVFEPRCPDAAESLAQAGRALARLAARPQDAEHLCREQTLRSNARLLERIHEALARHARRPEPWARVLDRFAAALRERLSHPAAWLPRDLVSAHGEDAARRLFLAHIDGAGRLFEAWPALFEAARELAAEGVRLSASLNAGEP